MAKDFSPEFWLNDRPKKAKAYTFTDPMEKAFKEKFGVDTFEFVRALYGYGGRQWECENAYAYLQQQIDILYAEMKLQYEEWQQIEFNPFSQLTAEHSPQLAVRVSAVG